MAYRDEGTITLKLLVQDLASGKVGAFVGHLDELAKKGGLVGAMAQGVGQSFGQMLNPVGLATDAIGRVTDFLGDSLAAAAEEQAGIRRLNTAIAENDAAWDGNSDRIEDVIAARERLAFSDGEQRDSLAKLVAITRDSAKALELQRTAMDLARLRGMSLADAGELVGKVYGGNVGILSRYGIQLRRGISATEALAEVQRMARGQAEAFAGSLEGQQQSLAIAVEDLQEDIGGLVTGPAEAFVGFLHGVVDSIRGPRGATGALKEMQDQVRGLGDAMDDVADPAKTWADYLERIDRQERQVARNDPRAVVQAWVRGYGQVAEVLGGTVDQLRDTAYQWQQQGRTMEEFQSDLMRRLAVEGPRAMAEQLGISVDEMYAELRRRTTSGAVDIGGALLQVWKEHIEGTFGRVGALSAAAFVGGVTGAAKGLRSQMEAAWESVAVEPAGKAIAAMADLIQSEFVIAKKKVRGEMVSFRIVAIKDPLDEATDEVRKKMKELRYAFENPLAQDQLERFYRRKIRAATRAMNRALRQGNSTAYAEASQLVADLRAKLGELERIDISVNVDMLRANYHRLYQNSGRKGSYWDSEHRAGGGPVYEDRPYVVGERGPELFVPDRDGRILPSGSRLGGDVHLHVHSVIADAASLERGVRTLMPEIRRAMGRAF